jgi:uncharacterized linocin/CFP29 family protein
MSASPPEPAFSPGNDLERYLVPIARALNRLRDRGVNGPYAVALIERCYTDLADATKAGYPVFEHVRRLVDGPLVWSPGLDGVAVLSMRGGFRTDSRSGLIYRLPPS